MVEIVVVISVLVVLVVLVMSSNWRFWQVTLLSSIIYPICCSEEYIFY